MNDLIGIESINAYVARAYIEVSDLFSARNLDLSRLENLMMQQRGVTLPCEDPVTYAVNAAFPLINAMSNDQRQHIEAVITASESGIDFGKSMSTQVHKFLGLSNRCRLFELKQACFGGNAALQVAFNMVRCSTSANAKVLVIATDLALPVHDLEYMEPAQGAGAVAVIVSKNPKIFQVDCGASGLHAFHIEDAFRPGVDIEIADKDLSLMAYMDCLEGAYDDYCQQVENAHLRDTFSYLVFHTPFAGMVKAAHRQIMRKKLASPADQIMDDFLARVQPSIEFCRRVGNLYSGALLLALFSLMSNARFQTHQRIGLYAYGSGCSAEFFSGVMRPGVHDIALTQQFKDHIEGRSKLSIQQYDELSQIENRIRVGDRDKIINFKLFQDIFDKQYHGQHLLFLKQLNHYSREYAWADAR